MRVLNSLSVIVIVMMVAGCDPPDGQVDRDEAPQPGWQVEATIGDSDTFGSIDAVRALGSNRLAVLDRLNRRVLVFSPDGEEVARFGGEGNGPGEFRLPSALVEAPDGDLLVLDGPNLRISVLRIEGADLTLASEIPLEFPAGDMCIQGDQLFLLGEYGGSVIHEVDRTGERRASFGAHGAEDPLVSALAAMGRIACSAETARIATASLTLGDLKIFSSDGELLYDDSIPGFSRTIYERSGAAVRPRTPEAGFAHRVEALRWLDEESLLVQLQRRPARGGVEFEDRRLVTGHGWTDDEFDFGIVGDVRDDKLFTIEEDPYPVVRVYRVVR